MDINTLNGTENLAIEAGDTMFNVLDHRDEPSGLVFHVNHISGTNRIAVAATGALIEVDINYHRYARATG